MANKLFLQTILKFSDKIKDGSVRITDIVDDYFRTSGKAPTEEESAILLKEFQDNAPSNVIETVFDPGMDKFGNVVKESPTQAAKTKGPNVQKAGDMSDTPFTDTLRKQNPDVEITGKESFDELMEKLGPSKEEGIGSLFPKGKRGEIFDIDNSKRDEVAEFVKNMRGAGIKNKDIKGVFKETGTDIEGGKRAATTLARAADMKADTKIKQEFLSELDEKIADKGPRFFNEEYQGFDSYGALINNEGKRIRNAIYDDLEEMGVDEDTISTIIRSANEVAERRPYEPEAFMASIKDDLEINEINYNTDFWDNYISKTLELSTKPAPRFEYGGMV
jgi:hypothetical protein